MQQKLILCFLVGGIFGLAASICICPATTQKEVFESSDWVAKVRFNAVSISESNTWLVYNSTFLQVFKPKNTTNIQGLIIANATLTNCNPIRFILLGEEYLIAARKNDKNYEIVECNGFPQHKSGRPILATPWELVTNKTLGSLKSEKF